MSQTCSNTVFHTEVLLARRFRPLVLRKMILSPIVKCDVLMWKCCTHMWVALLKIDNEIGLEAKGGTISDVIDQEQIFTCCAGAKSGSMV